MNEIFQALILGIVQGLTELLPISSSAHLNLFPWIFGWNEITGNSPEYRLIFLDKKSRAENKAYDLFMKHVFMFNQGAKFQGKQKDDCVDSLAGLVTNILEARATGAGKARSRISREKLGI